MLKNITMKRLILPTLAFCAIVFTGHASSPVSNVPPNVPYNDDPATEKALVSEFSHKPDYSESPVTQESYWNGYEDGYAYGAILKVDRYESLPIASDSRGSRAWRDGFKDGWKDGIKGGASKKPPSYTM